MAEAKIFYQDDCNLSLLDGKTIDYGIAAFVNFFTTANRDLFSPDISMLPTVHVMLSVNLLGALLWLWHTLKTEKRSWKNILIFAGSFTGFVCLVWLTAWGTGTWAKNAMEKKADELGIKPIQVAAQEPPELKALVNPEFYTKHPKYNPPLIPRKNLFSLEKTPRPL